MMRRITRSKNVSLKLMGKKRYRKAGLALVTASTLALVACSDQPTPIPKVETGVFDTVASCEAYYDKRNKAESSIFCATAEKEAQAQHEEVAPKYASLNACETEHGAGSCQTHQRSSGSFIPLMLGYWMGGGFSNNSGTRSAFSSQPLYKTSDGRYMSGGTKPVFLPGRNSAYRVSSDMWTKPGAATVESTKTAHKVRKEQAAKRAAERRTRTASRNGLGRTRSSSRFSWGG